MGPVDPQQRPVRRLDVQADHAGDRDRERLLAQGHRRRRRAVHHQVRRGDARPARLPARGGTSAREPEGHRFLNAIGEGGGTADLFSQTKNSVNCAYFRLLTSVGPPKVLEMANRLGMTRPVGHVPVDRHRRHGALAARDGDGVQHVRGRRHPPRPGVHHAGRGRRRARHLPSAGRQAGARPAESPGPSPTCSAHVTEGTGAQGEARRPAARGQDRDARRRRATRGSRLHAAARRRGLDGRPGRARSTR